MKDWTFPLASAAHEAFFYEGGGSGAGWAAEPVCNAYLFKTFDPLFVPAARDRQGEPQIILRRQEAAIVPSPARFNCNVTALVAASCLDNSRGMSLAGMGLLKKYP